MHYHLMNDFIDLIIRKKYCTKQSIPLTFCFSWFFFSQIWFPVPWARPKLPLWLRMTLSSWYSCLHYSSTKIIAVPYHAWVRIPNFNNYRFFVLLVFYFLNISWCNWWHALSYMLKFEARCAKMFSYSHYVVKNYPYVFFSTLSSFFPFSSFFFFPLFLVAELYDCRQTLVLLWL